jgi:hypothetical protein
MLLLTKFAPIQRRLWESWLPVTTLCTHLPGTGLFSRYGFRGLHFFTLSLTVPEGARL